MLMTSDVHRCGGTVSIEVAAFTKLLQANHHVAAARSVFMTTAHRREGGAAGSPARTRTPKASAGRASARRCGFPECGKTAKPGGFCISHGGGKKCAVDGCTTSVVSRGFCVAHGGGKRCQHPECAKSAQTGGFCWIHGGGKKCGVQGCTKRAQSGGACISHGGGKRCRVDGCNKVVQYEGLCVSHGGYRRCLSINCTRKALANSYCPLHGGSSHCSVPGCGKRAVRGGACGEHKLLAARSAQKRYQQQQQQQQRLQLQQQELHQLQPQQFKAARRSRQSSDEEEAAAAVPVDVRLKVEPCKTPELRAAADAVFATSQRPDLSPSPLSFQHCLDARWASPEHEIKPRAGSPGSLVPPLRDVFPTTISPTVGLQSRFSLYAQVTADPDARVFTPPSGPASAAATTAAAATAAVTLAQLKPGPLPGIQLLQQGLRGRLFSSPAALPPHAAWESRSSSPFHEQQRSLSSPSLVAVSSDGHLRCVTSGCARFAKRGGLCLLHDVPGSDAAGRLGS